MLELRNIKKEYPVGGGVVSALQGVSLQFRKAEFVSILGPSGCGKTTLLNIIGGLDQCTTGELLINGQPTGEFNDKDWDNYRNHSVGFVFQSYNLIPYQTVFENVELSLLLSGVPKAERQARTEKALQDVGLGELMHKKPNELSGGQMQRVAIARALVNEPDIILADEPTGALDTETSRQIVGLLKEISKDHLVIMVTHNPELAQAYSSRIVHMLDGRITQDSAPVTPQELEGIQEQAALPGQQKKASLSFWTGFMLSLNNMFSKKGRTLLTSFAGAIGIIGMALILAVSRGMTDYIEEIQQSTMTSYPVTIEQSSKDMDLLMERALANTIGGTDDESFSDTLEDRLGSVYQVSAVQQVAGVVDSLTNNENDIPPFKAYLDEQLADENSEMRNALMGVQYTYDLDLQIYTKDVDGNIIRSDASSMMEELLSAGSGVKKLVVDQLTVWQELLSGVDGELINEAVTDQYDLLYGSWPESYNQIIFVVDDNSGLTDVSLYTLGLISEEEMELLVDGDANALAQQNVWSYEELCGREFKVILGADCYRYNSETGVYEDIRKTEEGLKYLYENAMPLEITGIAQLNDGSDTNIISGSICYTSELVMEMLARAENSQAVKAQKATPEKDVLTGKMFRSSIENLSAEEKRTELLEYLATLPENERASAYVKLLILPDQATVDEQVDAQMEVLSDEQKTQLVTQSLSKQTNLDVDSAELQDYVAGLEQDEYDSVLRTVLETQARAQYESTMRALAGTMPDAEKSEQLDELVGEATDEMAALYYETLIRFSSSTYEQNLKAMGSAELSAPTEIALYAATFEDKSVIEQMISDYNAGVEDEQQIAYTDYMGLMLSTVSMLVQAITYVLVAFVAISLCVSSIMIGIITLISVQERTKEIGILRAIGASKSAVCRMFNAETLIIGFASGVLGVGVTWLICIPANYMLHNVLGIAGLSVVLIMPAAVGLVVISMLLTLLAGIIPSRSAAKKNPAVVLRVE